MIRVILSRYRAHAGLKAAMGLWDLDCGPNRLPTVPLTLPEAANLRRDLDALGFFQWAA